MEPCVTFDTFVDMLEKLAASGFNRDQVQTYLETTRIEPAQLEPHLTYKKGRYTRNLVHKTPAFEILVVCWGVGHRAPVHGHEGELCWARVERGKLRFANYRLVSEAPLVVEPVGQPVNGGPGHLDGPADIHSVENCSEFGADAVSLHIYSRPYTECDIYDLARAERRRVRLAYDTIYGKPAAG
jgi:cysteine dioxygenase